MLTEFWEKGHKALIFMGIIYLTITKWITCWSTDTMHFPNPWNWMQLPVFILAEVSLCTSHVGLSARALCAFPGSAHTWGSSTRKEGAAKNPYSTSISIPLKQKTHTQNNAEANITQLYLAGKREILWMEKLDEKLEVWSKSASLPDCNSIPEVGCCRAQGFEGQASITLACLHTSFSACPSAAPVLSCHIILISRLKNLFAETLICIIPVMTLKLQLSYLTLHVPYWYHSGQMKLCVQDFQGQENSQNRLG